MFVVKKSVLFAVLLFLVPGSILSEDWIQEPTMSAGDNTGTPTSPSFSVETNPFKSEEQSDFCSIKKITENLMGYVEKPLADYEKKIASQCGPFREVQPSVGPAGQTYSQSVCYSWGGICEELNQKIGREKKCFSDYQEFYIENGKAVGVPGPKDFIFRQTREKIQKHMKYVRGKVRTIADEGVEKAASKSLSLDPTAQVRITWQDLYTFIGTAKLAIADSDGAGDPALVAGAAVAALTTAVTDWRGKAAITTGTTLLGVGPLGFFIVSGMDVMEEGIQCRVSVKNILLKTGIAGASYIIMKVPILKDAPLEQRFAGEFLRGAGMDQVKRYVLANFGDGLEVSQIRTEQQQGVNLAVITIKAAAKTQ